MVHGAEGGWRMATKYCCFPSRQQLGIFSFSSDERHSLYSDSRILPKPVDEEGFWERFAWSRTVHCGRTERFVNVPIGHSGLLFIVAVDAVPIKCVESSSGPLRQRGRDWGQFQEGAK